MRLLTIALICLSLSSCGSETTVDPNEVPPPDQPFNGQTPVSEQIVSPPMFQVKYQIVVDTDLFGRIISRKTYSLQNTGEAFEAIKWVAINNREDCLAVPIFNSYERTIRSLEVLPESSSVEIADFLKLEVGQEIKLGFPESCGEPVRLKVGTERGEYDIGPLIF